MLVTDSKLEVFLCPRFRVDTNGIHFLYGVINAVICVQARIDYNVLCFLVKCLTTLYYYYGNLNAS